MALLRMQEVWINIFFHISNAPSSISERDVVSFELERGQKGMNAVRISFADKSQSLEPGN